MTVIIDWGEKREKWQQIDEIKEKANIINLYRITEPREGRVLRKLVKQVPIYVRLEIL